MQYRPRFVGLAARPRAATPPHSQSSDLAPREEDQAGQYHIADVPVSILGLTLPALSFALSIDRVLNGVTRPFFGWVSDRIGRENTMFVAFSLEGIGIFLLSRFGQDPLSFVQRSPLCSVGR